MVAMRSPSSTISTVSGRIPTAVVQVNVQHETRASPAAWLIRMEGDHRHQPCNQP